MKDKAKKHIEKRKNKIKKLYQAIIDTGFTKGDKMTLNYNNILTDLYIVNNLINSTSNILKNNSTTDREKAIKITQLRDNKNRPVVKNLEEAEKLVKNKKKPITELFSKIKTRQQYYRDKAMKQKMQKGGSNKDTKKAQRHLEDILKNIERVTQTKIDNFNKEISENPLSLIDNIKNSEFGENRESTYTVIFDWVFHPLWKLENIPRWGSLFEIPIDFVDSLLNNAILIVESVYPIISLILSVVGTTGVSAMVAPLPVVGPMLAGSSWQNIIQPFLDWIIPNFLKIIAFFINISRRDVPSAYINMMDFIPFMEDTVSSLTSIAIKINRYIDMIYPITNTIRGYTEFSSNFALAVLKNPNILIDLDQMYFDVIKPNKKIIPLIKDLPEEVLEKEEGIILILYETVHDISKCVREGLEENNIAKCTSLLDISSIKDKFSDKFGIELE